MCILSNFNAVYEETFINIKADTIHNGYIKQNRISNGISVYKFNDVIHHDPNRTNQLFTLANDNNISDLRGKDRPQLADYNTPAIKNVDIPASRIIDNVPVVKNVESLGNIKGTLKSIYMLSLWYAGTVMYNIENKKALNICPLPKSIAALQMLIGIPYFFCRWMFGLRPTPKIHISDTGIEKENPHADIFQRIKQKVKNSVTRIRNAIQSYKCILKQSAVFSLLHLLSVTALGAGAISFVHVIKASEPLFVSAISLLTGTGSMSPITYLTLLPILGGVAMASMKDVNFSPLAFATSLASNVCASIRRIEAKKFFKQDLSKIGENLDPVNISSLVTIFSSIFLAPLALTEVSKWNTVYKTLLYKFSHKGLLKLARHILLSGFFYVLYNEVSFIALSQLNPVTHAVANTLKRIFLIVTSSVLFNTKLTNMSLYGSATAIAGALLYSLSKQYYG
eukprot:XP_001610919.1 triose phosphate/phosphate translocator [Babesia bovis T2Bo]